MSSALYTQFVVTSGALISI